MLVVVFSRYAKGPALDAMDGPVEPCPGDPGMPILYWFGGKL